MKLKDELANPIALRLNFVDVICDDSLKNIYVNGKKTGCQFDVRLSYYRGHFLSTIDILKVFIDGTEIPQQDISFALKGKEYGVAQIPDLVNVFWPIAEPATIKVFLPGGLAEGDHDINFVMYFRSPYMAISESAYMPIDSSGEKTLRVKN
ncbi:MAG: hypothetical protein IJ106_08140 [Parasporobacterium sp.]|nr:hypothetical protein [Parasporobacterium sp.]